MSNKNARLCVVVLVLCFATVAAVPAFAGSSVVGSMAGSLNATLSGQPILVGSTVFVGDKLKVQDGAAVVTFGQGSRAVFGRNSEVSFSREGERVTVHLASGNVSIFQPSEERNGMRVRLDNVTIDPSGGYKTLGEVAMLGDSVVVRTKEGMMDVSFANGKSTEVPAGEVLRLVPNSQRAPQQAAGSQHYASEGNWVEYAALAAGGTAAILAGISISKANDATTAGNNATAAANGATSAANAATAAANSATAAASSAGTAAVSAASAATANANLVGCALDAFEVSQGQASTYSPPSGETCPATPVP